MEIIKGSLFKQYKNNYVFAGPTISIEEGEIYLLIGRNGIGKSTLLRILAKVEDYNILNLINKNDISYMPSNLIYYKNMRVIDLLKFYQDTHDNFSFNYSLEHLQTFNIIKNQKIVKLSDGERKILAFIICLSFECSLYIIDEPFPYVDLLYDEYFRKMIINKSNELRTFIIATHQIHEFEKIANKFIFIKNKNEIEISNSDDIRLETSLSIEQYFKEKIKC